MYSVSGPTGAAASWVRDDARVVHASGPVVFNLIAEAELWPALFRHVRSTRVVRRDGRRRLVVVKARWHHVPIDIVAIQTIDDADLRMTVQHVSRLTGGSFATWTVRPAGRTAEAAVRVQVHLHQSVRVAVPMVGCLLARKLIGGRVARDLGRSTLERLKEVAEGASLAGRS